MGLRYGIRKYRGNNVYLDACENKKRVMDVQETKK